MRNSDTPRHARVRHGHSGRLHRALLPAALGGVVAGCMWLATDAAAAPAPSNSGSAPGGSYSAAPGPTPTDGGWGGSYAAWRDGDGQNSYDGRYPNHQYTHSDDGHYQDRRPHDGQYPREGWQHEHHDYNRQHDRSIRTGDHSYASHPQVMAARSTTTPHRATSTQARTKSATPTPTQTDPATAPTPPTAPPTSVNVVAAAVAPVQHSVQDTAQKARAVRTPQSTAAGSIRLSGTQTSRQSPPAARSDLAAVDTARPVTDYVMLYGAIGGAALAALLGMGGVALWRRRGAVGAR